MLILVAFLFLWTIAAAGWVGPFEIMSNTSTLTLNPVYRDPATGLNHILVTEQSWGRTHHLAVNDQGVVVYKSQFNTGQMHDPLPSFIRGAGDGRKLLAVLTYFGFVEHVIQLIESKDGGRSWPAYSEEYKILGKYDTVQDLVYIAETGWTMVLYMGNKFDLRMAIRAPGSKSFSVSPIIYKKMAPEATDQARAGYSMYMSKPIIHVAFVPESSDCVLYTRSQNYGVTWQKPVQISPAGTPCGSILALATNPKPSPIFYVVYTTAGPALMTYSENYGNSFEDSLKITSERAMSDTPFANGVAVCGTTKDNTVATMMVNRFLKLEYSVWDITGRAGKQRTYPDRGQNFTAAGLACVTVGKSTDVSTFAVMNYTRLFFAHETITAAAALTKS